MTPTQQFYGIIPGWLIFYTTILLALVLFCRQVFHLYQLLRLGRPVNRVDQVAARLKGFAVHVLGQGRLLKDFWPGLMHFTIFWGFVILTLGTIEFFGKGFSDRFSLPLLSENPMYLVLQDLFDVAVLLAVCYAGWRRLVSRVARLTLSTEGLVILVLIGGLMVTDLLADAARMAVMPVAQDRWSPVGFALSGLFVPLSRGATRGLYEVFWWAHLAILLGFLVWLPYSKHLHIMAAPFNVFFRPLTPKGEFRSLDLEVSETFGVSQLREFTWKDLFDLYNCTECGRCTAGCPATASGKKLDPKLLILDLQEHLLRDGPDLLKRDGGDGKIMVGKVITDNVLWACTTCLACVQACPVFIEHVPKIVDMRRHLVLNESRFPEELKPTFRNLEANGNPWQLSSSTRAEWAADLGVKLMGDAAQAEYLYWVGCYGSFDQRNRKVARAFVRLLQAAGVDFAILGNEERCTGEPARRVGNEYLFQMLAQENIETLRKYRFQTIVTACPHCFNTITNEYPQFGGRFRVIHHTQLIDELIRTGRVRVRRDLSKTVTYHDPCYLGRYNDIYDPPRRVLHRLCQKDLVEMHLHRERGFCCGGGGGRVWLEEREGRRVNHLRMEQALAVKPDILASACPFCLTMFEDGVRAKGATDQLATRDIAELVMDALQ